VRKLVLIAAFALASVSAQAAERIDRVPAEIDAPAAAAAPATAPPVIASPPATAKPQASGRQASRKQASRKQPSRSRMTLRETDEQKARQIAAQYGISW
jgi:hypothetical protein